MKNLAQLAIDLYENKNMVYNEKSGQDAMRNMFYDILGVEPGTKGRALYTAFQNNKHNLFEVISVAVDAVLPRILKTEFDSLANFVTIGIGDEYLFTQKNPGLFRVGMVASGTQDIRRQTKLGSSYKVATDWYAAGTYAEFEQFLTGQIDWNDYVQTVADSFAAYMGQRIFMAFSTSYDAVRANRKHTGTVSLDKLLELVRHVRAASNAASVKVYGTVNALAQVAKDLELSDVERENVNRLGYLSTVRGIELIAFPDAYAPGTEEFLVDDKSLLIIPANEKIVDVVLEGDAMTIEGEPSDNNALQLEYKTLKKFGIQVRQSAVYGFYKIEG